MNTHDLAFRAANGMLSFDAEGEWRLNQKEVERFAHLVRAQVLEEAAKKRAKPPRNLPRRGTGALLAEQQYCYELGYREGATAVRAAIRALKERLK